MASIFGRKTNTNAISVIEATLTGSSRAEQNFTLSDGVTTTSVRLGKTFRVAPRPASGPPATPTEDDKATIYAKNAFRRSYTGFDSAEGVIQPFDGVIDALSESDKIRRISTVSVSNISPDPIAFSCAEISTAPIVIAPYGLLNMVFPLDGISVEGSGFH